jgi:hypothetical protein
MVDNMAKRRVMPRAVGPTRAEPLLRRAPWGAKRLGVSRRVLYGMVASKVIPEHIVLRLGRAMYLRVVAFESWATGRDGQHVDHQHVG